MLCCVTLRAPSVPPPVDRAGMRVAEEGVRQFGVSIRFVADFRDFRYLSSLCFSLSWFLLLGAGAVAG